MIFREEYRFIWPTETAILRLLIFLINKNFQFTSNRRDELINKLYENLDSVVV